MRQRRADGPAAVHNPVTTQTRGTSKGAEKEVRGDVRRARVGVFILFSLTGVVTGSYLSRLPTIREDLDLTFAQAGTMLLCQSIAALILVPMAGAIVQRIGSRKVVVISAGLFTTAFVLIGVAPTVGSVPLFGVALACMGAGFGLGNVPQNIESAAVERGVGRAIISQFHASYSLGCVAGAGIGAVTSALDVPLLQQFLVTAVVTLFVRLYAVRLFLPDADPLVGLVQAREVAVALKVERAQEKARVGQERAENKTVAKARQAEYVNREKELNSSRKLPAKVKASMSPARVRATILPPRTARPARRNHKSSVSAWAEPRTLLIGVVLISASMSEGSANDWLPLGVVTGFGQSESVGAICFAIFLAAMTTVRLLGAKLIDVFGRVRVLRYSACASFVGLILFAVAPNLAVGVVGILAWGLGAALIVPICVSAASDDPLRAAGRVSVISSFSSAAGLAVPPMFGFVAEHIGVQHSLGLIAFPMVATIALAFVVAPATRTVVAANNGSSTSSLDINESSSTQEQTPESWDVSNVKPEDFHEAAVGQSRNEQEQFA